MEKEIEFEKEFLDIIKDIIYNDKFKELKNFIHHKHTTRYQHCINVAYYSFKMAKKFKSKHIKEIVIGALLHDFFFYDWHNCEKRNGFFMKYHAFYHPFDANNNASVLFKLNDLEQDIILTHMWPCSLKMPKHKECFFIILSDKYSAIKEGLFSSNVIFHYAYF